MTRRARATRGVAVTVLYFAVTQDAAGRARERVRLPAHATIAGISTRLVALHPRLAGLLPSCRLAVNGEFATGRVRLKDGDELAVLPPVAGG